MINLERVDMDLTILVLGLSPNVTLNDLIIFFSYCGTVEKVVLESEEDQSQLGIVTFRQPYALKTALLLDDAIIVDRHVKILPSNKLRSSGVSGTMDHKSNNNEKVELIPAAQRLMWAAAAKGYETLNRTKQKIDEKYNLSEKSRHLTQRAWIAISAAEEAVRSHLARRAGQEK
ncbi:hypothetical protein Scep_018367 [Stephania cephalantha]|uniref:RRM domain-containing protein n=1 Tax=Stephania cephalantha TaxID=152367 RepID=A0AAP0IRE6_9MAGN